MASDPRPLTEGQRSYEARRAAKAGVSLDKWLENKTRTQEAAARAERKAAEASQRSTRKPGFFARLIERAHKPL
ncbi:MAG: hypothetical protein HIU82_21590 [Proteobacteria bacterium]|nr:hypothetical protein [Pseudomonadota bacterium]